MQLPGMLAFDSGKFNVAISSLSSEVLLIAFFRKPRLQDHLRSQQLCHRQSACGVHYWTAAPRSPGVLEIRELLGAPVRGPPALPKVKLFNKRAQFFFLFEYIVRCFKINDQSLGAGKARLLDTQQQCRVTSFYCACRHTAGQSSCNRQRSLQDKLTLCAYFFPCLQPKHGAPGGQEVWWRAQQSRRVWRGGGECL